ENIGTAMHSDRVVARISRDAPYDRIKGRREGRVIRILERAHDTIVGTLQRSRNFYYVVPDDPRFVHDIYVRGDTDKGVSTRASLGDKVVVRLEPWESRHVNPEGEIIEVLGPATAPGIDMLSIIRKFHLPAEFPKDVLNQADRIIPMLPERLSNGVCSLNPGVDRLTHSVFINFDKNGAAKSARFARSVIRSAHRLTYKQAYTILSSPPRDELGERLHLAWQLA